MLTIMHYIANIPLSFWRAFPSALNVTSSIIMNLMFMCCITSFTILCTALILKALKYQLVHVIKESIPCAVLYCTVFTLFMAEAHGTVNIPKELFSYFLLIALYSTVSTVYNTWKNLSYLMNYLICKKS